MRKKNSFLINTFVFLGIFLALSISCKKNDDNNSGGGGGGGGYAVNLPVLTTTAVSDITLNTARSGGEISNDGGSTVSVRGVCWSLGSTPTIERIFFILSGYSSIWQNARFGTERL